MVNKLTTWLTSLITHPSVMAVTEPIEKFLTPHDLTMREIVECRERCETLLMDIQYDLAKLRGYVDGRIVASELVARPPTTTLLLD